MQSPLNPKIMYDFWDCTPPQLPLYQQITLILHPKPQPHHTIHQKTPCPMSYYISCKNVQKTTCPQIHAIILYYYGMFLSGGGIFTFSITAVFSPGMGCVLLKRKPPNLNHRFYAHFINCVKFSHNSPKTPKITSILTSIKPLYFLVKLNFQTI